MKHRLSAIFPAALIVATLGTTIAQADDVNLGAFKPLPASAENPENPLTPQKIALGKKLYLDNRLSGDRDISCNTCHHLNHYGVDNLPTSQGHKGQLGNRNAPTVYNAALHIAQFWDGRSKDVEAQALGPVMNPVEMAMPSEGEVLSRVKADKDYPALFAKAFPAEKEPVTFQNIGKAIGAFERTLLTPSRFDKFLAGDKKALTAPEQEGLKVFVNTGCIMCHNGAPVGGLMFQKLGLVRPYETKDLGRYEVTKNDADKYFFKVPSLRNIAETAPYFHDGSIKTLPEAVKLMGAHQLGKDLSENDVASIVTFLRSLTGTIPASAK